MGNSEPKKKKKKRGVVEWYCGPRVQVWVDEADEERATYNTPLMEAAANGRAGCVARLLDSQADINKVRWLAGWLVEVRTAVRSFRKTLVETLFLRRSASSSRRRCARRPASATPRCVVF